MTLRYSMAAFAALACVGLGGNNASASTVCLNATHGATNYGPDTSCATSAESEALLLARAADEYHEGVWKHRLADRVAPR